jgi:hypothetical protein
MLILSDTPPKEYIKIYGSKIIDTVQSSDKIIREISISLSLPSKIPFFIYPIPVSH